MLSARAPEAVEGVAGHVVAASHRDRLDGVRHVVDRDPEEPFRHLHRRGPPAGAARDLAGQGGELPGDRVAVERLVLVRSEDPREELRLQLAQQHVAVGDAQRTAPPVAGGSRVRPGRLGSHPIAGSVERADRASARCNRVDHHHRGAHAHPGHHRLERALVGAVVVGDVGRGPAHVERDDARVAGVCRGLGRAHDAAGGTGQDRVLALEQLRVGEAAVRLHEHQPHALAELVRHPVDVAAQQGREVRIRHRGVAAADELHQRARPVAGGDLGKADGAGQLGQRELVLRMTVAVHEHDGDRPDPVRVRLAQGRSGSGRVERDQHLAVRRHPAVHLRHALVEHFRERDPQVEQVRPGLVADAKRVAEAPVDHQQGPIALALQERVGGDGGAHLDAGDAGDGRIGGGAEKLADALNGGVPVVLRVVGEELAGDERAVGTAGDDIGERPATVDPELPATRSAVHRVLRPVSRKRRRGLSTERSARWHRRGLGNPPDARSGVDPCSRAELFRADSRTRRTRLRAVRGAAASNVFGWLEHDSPVRGQLRGHPTSRIADSGGRAVSTHLFRRLVAVFDID